MASTMKKKIKTTAATATKHICHVALPPTFPTQPPTPATKNNVGGVEGRVTGGAAEICCGHGKTFPKNRNDEATFGHILNITPVVK